MDIKPIAKPSVLKTQAKLVAATERIDRRDPTSASNFRLQKRVVREKKSEWAKKFGIAEQLWYIWDTGMTLTKVGSHELISALRDPDAENDDRYEQAVRVLDDVTQRSKPIMELDRSLMSILSNHTLNSLRVYVLFPEGMEERCRAKISNAIRNDLQEINWN
ncbi:MAG: hypothetical protein M3Q60_11720 [Actinomycetota bacterium]|nr:hypothetical protein [Actinomycetota bacterium]